MKKIMFVLVVLMLFVVVNPAYGQVSVYDFELTELSLDFNAKPKIEPDSVVVKAGFFDGWDSKDTALLVLRIVDWGQTRWLVTNPVKSVAIIDSGTGWTEYTIDYYECSNPLFKAGSTLKEVDLYFVGILSLDQYFRYKANPTNSPNSYERWIKFNKYWKNVNIVLESICVINNNEIGLKFNYNW